MMENSIDKEIFEIHKSRRPAIHASREEELGLIIKVRDGSRGRDGFYYSFAV